MRKQNKKGSEDEMRTMTMEIKYILRSVRWLRCDDDEDGETMRISSKCDDRRHVDTYHPDFIHIFLETS